jgi:cell division protein FtsB
MVNAEPASTGRKPAARAAAETPKRRLVHVLLLFVSCVLVVDALVGDKGLMETLRARRRQGELQIQLDRLRQENAALRERARRLREDPRAIEEVARRELGLIRPGELLFIIRDVPNPATAPAR